MKTKTANRIPITKPSITQLEIDYVNDAIRNGWGPHCYDYIIRFEKEFGGYIGSKHAVATSSCTGALHLALAALGIGKDDEVIVPEITWIATVAPVMYLGAKPVFVDILPDTWCIDPEKIKKAITRRTKAIIPVHVYGNLAEMDEILSLAREHNLYVIEDAAEALGSEYKGKKAGSMGDAGVFSFHGTKTLSTGEGGALVTSNDEIVRKVKILNDHGRIPEEKKLFFPHVIGYKYKISNLQAAMGCAQIERVEELVDKKREIFSWYKELFSDMHCKMNHEQEYAKNSYWMPTVVFDDISEQKRDELINYLKEHNIDTRPFFYPLSSLHMFDKNRGNTVSYDICYKGLNLPSYHEINRADALLIRNRILNNLKP